jgi:hypothetical protein
MVEGRVTRDRDERGRPRNARPRDPLGRPLARDADAPAPVEPPPLPPEEALRSAESLLREGAAFRAHEVLEAVWKSTAVDRELWRGLAQLAVGVTHRQRGNDRGANALFARAATTLTPYAGRRPHGVEVDALLRWLAAAPTDEDARVPRLTSTGSGG